MAIFLQESINQQAPAAAESTFDVLNALCEFAVEQSRVTETLLREDFMVHEQIRSLNEAGDTAGAAEKEKGFAGAAWETIKSFLRKAKETVIRVYNWIKEKISKFWSWVKEKYSTAKKFVIRHGKILAMRAAIAFGGAAVSVAASVKVTNDQAEQGFDHLMAMRRAMKDAKAKANEGADTEISHAELDKLMKDSEGIGASAQRSLDEMIAMNAGNQAHVKKAAEELMHAMSAVTGVIADASSAKPV